MAKNSTQSFILSLKLNTSSHDDRILNDRFYVAFLMKNRLIKHARKALSTMRQDKSYRALLKEYLSFKSKDDPDSVKQRSVISKQLSDIRSSYGLSEYQFHEWISVQQHRYKKYIDSLTAQKIATYVWKSVEDVLFRKGKTIHFKRLDALTSLEGKNNASGMRFKDGRLCWSGLVIGVQIRKGDAYAREALTHKVKYCRIVRKPMGTSYHYYLQLILEGHPPVKHVYLKSGDVGLDQGTSSEAVVSDKGCILWELSSGVRDIDKQARRLQRKLDRSRRANNHGNYNPDGTVKPKRLRSPWNNSKTYKRTAMELRTIRRKAADQVKQSDEVLANDILCNHGSNVFTEKMDYRALQLRSKDTKTNSRGKFISKKRFGKSLSKHAPGKFLLILERKLSYIDKTVNYVDTWKFKASQYDHVLGDYIKSGLNDRAKAIRGRPVQRDLYSAFLLRNAKDSETINRDECFKIFDQFLVFHDDCIRELLSLRTVKHLPSSFGLNELNKYFETI